MLPFLLPPPPLPRAEAAGAGDGDELGLAVDVMRVVGGGFLGFTTSFCCSGTTGAGAGAGEGEGEG